jgi:hypothetical protein
MEIIGHTGSEARERNAAYLETHVLKRVHTTVDTSRLFEMAALE